MWLGSLWAGSSAAGSPWYLVVASPTFSTDEPPAASDLHAFSVRSTDFLPSLAKLYCIVFVNSFESGDGMQIPHGTFVAMKRGLWHAGPFFEGQKSMSFFNLVRKLKCSSLTAVELDGCLKIRSKGLARVMFDDNARLVCTFLEGSTDSCLKIAFVYFAGAGGHKCCRPQYACVG
jgi:hypothetical protein